MSTMTDPDALLTPGGVSPAGRLIVAVIPTYRSRETIVKVVRATLEFVDRVIVVDDACPDGSGSLVADLDSRVELLVNAQNLGVGGSTKAGFARAIELGAAYVVKIDSDDQMDPSYIPELIDALETIPELALAKGNRFVDSATLHKMPPLRLIGNSGLTFLVKFASGYWTIVDPTNGYVALRTEDLGRLDVASLNNRYFFEIDLLCALGRRKLPIAELEMPAIYRGERSSLSIAYALWTFPFRLIDRFLRRLLMSYLITEINVATLCTVLGIPLLIFAVVFGGSEWYKSNVTGIPRPTGTIILALLLFMIGFQLTLQAIIYDVQFCVRTVKLRGRRVTAVRQER